MFKNNYNWGFDWNIVPSNWDTGDSLSLPKWDFGVCCSHWREMFSSQEAISQMLTQSAETPRETQRESDTQSLTDVFYRGRYREKTSDGFVDCHTLLLRVLYHRTTSSFSATRLSHDSSVFEILAMAAIWDHCNMNVLGFWSDRTTFFGGFLWPWQTRGFVSWIHLGRSH